MEDTQTSMKSMTDAAATRKRRSSILKSQRPPRTPLSELEFNVATPTDTAKSRRVSFSRRTGVAEFVTNEGTTTWKNFYEEHNKSLETSGNESVANAPRHMSIGHIGKRIFDQQFEEVEIVDIGGILQPKSLAQDFHSSLNNLNITQQLASLECPHDDRKLTAPFQNFELSSLTDHQSKVFGDDHSIPTMPEMTNPIDINFSMRPMNSKDNCDDLDEIVKDFGRMQPTNVIGPGHFNGDNMSEYIEVDLNMTHIAIKNDDCEMSITDTIRNPEVQEVSKSISSIHSDKKLNDENDWIVDKENIAINPYIAPKETKNFNINESSDKILVFDGKKLTVKSERETIPHLDIRDDYRSTLLSNQTTGASPKRKTIVLNTNDDLPNFISDNPSMVGNQQTDSSKDIPQFKQSIIIYNECDMSITQAVNNKVNIPKRQTIVFEDDMGNISITQAVPAKVIINKQEKRKTIIYENDNANISVTQVVPTNIMGGVNKTIVEKRKTIVYEDDISFTQALPGNLLVNDNSKITQDKTMFYQDDYDISVTQGIPENILDVGKNKSNCNIGNNSVIQADKQVKPTDSAMTLIYDAHESEDIEITQAVSHNIILPVKNNEKRTTMIFEDDAGDLSVTGVVPENVLLETLAVKSVIKAESLKTEENMSLNKSCVNSGKVKAENNSNNQNDNIENSNRRKTIIYNDEAGNVSMTQVMPSNIIVSESDKMGNSSDNNIADISVTRVLPTNIYVQESVNQMKEESTSRQSFSCNAQQSFITNMNASEKNDILFQLIEDNKTERQSELNETSGGNLSITKPIPSNIIDCRNEIIDKEKDECPRMETDDLLKPNLSIKQDIFLYQALEQSISETEIESEVAPLKSGSCIKDTNESLVCEEKFIANNTYDITSSKSLSNTKISENYSEEKQNMDDECVNEISVEMRQSKTKYVDENLKVKKSFINELLDMSNASLKTVAESDVSAVVSGIVDKSIIKNISPNNKEKSNESLFVITSDSEDGIKEENVEDNNIADELEKSITNKPKQNVTKNIPAIEYVEETEDVHDLHSKIAELQAANNTKIVSNNRHYERVVSSDLCYDKESSNKSAINDKSMRNSKKSFVNADDTRELLKMLSDFTEGTTDQLDNDKSIAMVKTKESLPIESKPNRLSCIPKRQSLSREQLLSNISMAQAALQQSQFEIFEDESMEETQDSPEESRDSPEEVKEDDKSRRKSVRISNEVVKTLQFEEDDSCISEESLKSSVKTTPLKKTAFGETTYMRESKGKVIPSYLKDVSDNLKSLMDDLVKPMADVPFESVLDRSLKTTGSTCSTQIQANLIASSQIDVELHSNSGSDENIRNAKTNRSPVRVMIEKPISTNNVDRSLSLSFHTVSASKNVDHSLTIQSCVERPIPRSTENDPVIVFDPSNPLNNILLAPIDGVKVHKYNPIRSTETMHSERENFTQMEDNKTENIIEVERLSTHYNLGNVTSREQSMLQSGDDERIKDSSSLASNVSKPLSIDRSTDGLATELRSTEVNTLIAMKANKDLLEASSSLTLVDDALARSLFDTKIQSQTSKESNRQKSPLRVIYQMGSDGELLQKIDSDATSNIETDEDNDNPNTRKRSYSPTRRNEDTADTSNVEITPKPLSKMQKMSNSPREHKKINDRLDKLLLCLDKMDSVPNIREDSTCHIKSPKKKSPKRDKVIVQRVSTEYDREAKIGDKTLEATDSSKGDAESVKSVDIINSFTSSIEAEKVQDVDRKSFSNPHSESNMNWRADLEEPSSRNLSDCSSTVNVVDRINMLKFMGRECEWESSGGDVWVFRLLRSRIRLTARLSHRHQNASRSRVLADTPLEGVTVEPVGQDIKDPIAALCVRFAGEAMRYECAREGECARASHVPALLRRCARVARVAVRWARAMRDARYHLAYSVTHDGAVTLKVANFPLRSVWEVRFRLELVVGDAEQVAWPCAGDVRACAVLADTASTVDVAKIAAQMPQDWRHAPATIWSVFRYLKNKTGDEDHFLGLL